MTSRHTADDVLLQRLLGRTEAHLATSNADGSGGNGHPDEEALALFDEGLLPSMEHNAIVDHLSNCSACRSLIGMLWKTEVPVAGTLPASARVQVIRETEASGSALTQRKKSLRSSISVVAIAALVLMAVMTWQAGGTSALVAERRTYRQAEQMLASADFGNARRVLENAERSGIRSGRLLSLNLQALRELPGSLSLDSSGTLLDFGYDLDGTLSRDVANQPTLQGAAAILEREGQQSDATEPLELILNRGHLRLSQNDIEAAIADFNKARSDAPEEPLAWLGLGLAEFARNEFQKAEAAFRSCVRLAPKLVAAHINLAMTLEELGRLDEAREVWNSVVALLIDGELRDRIERHLEELK